MILFRWRVPVENENHHRNEAVGGSIIAGAEVDQSERKRKGLVVEVVRGKSRKNLQITHPKFDENELRINCSKFENLIV